MGPGQLCQGVDDLVQQFPEALVKLLIAEPFQVLATLFEIIFAFHCFTP
jgi:hypothetical protein